MDTKKIILLVIILLTIIAITLICIIIYSSYKENYEYDLPSEDIPTEIVSTIEKVEVVNNYYMAKSCIDKFYQYLTKINTDDYRIPDEETMYAEEKIKKQAVYEMLDGRYISYNNITMDNVFEKIQQIGDSRVIINDMYVSQKDINTYAYIIYGKLIENETQNETEFNMILEIDMLNRTFKLILQDYISKNIGSITEGEELKFDIPKEIEKETYNTFDYNNISEQTYVTDLFDELKTDLMYNYKRTYEKLDKDYRAKRFTSYEDFETYAKEKSRKSLEMQLDTYEKTKIDDDITRYVFKDKNDNYYILYETSIMQYTVILDTYTVDLPEFTEKYNNAEDSEKVLLNIQKVFSAINDGDYRYVYNKLDSTFKQNNFPTEADFENYIKQKFYEKNSVSCSNYKTSGNLHIYETSIRNKDDDNSAEKTKNIIMQLKEGTDFVMSFNV